MANDNKNTAPALTPEELQAKIDALTAEKEELLSSNSELQSQLEESQKTVETVMTVVSDGKKKYQLLAKKAQIKGKVYEAKDLAEDKEAVAHLVKINSGLLKQL